MPEGNYLGRKRKNFYLSRDVCHYIVILAHKLGLSEGGVIEIAVRELHKKEIGDYPWEPPHDHRKLR